VLLLQVFQALRDTVQKILILCLLPDGGENKTRSKGREGLQTVISMQGLSTGGKQFRVRHRDQGVFLGILPTRHLSVLLAGPRTRAGQNSGQWVVPALAGGAVEAVCGMHGGSPKKFSICFFDSLGNEKDATNRARFLARKKAA